MKRRRHFRIHCAVPALLLLAGAGGARVRWGRGLRPAGSSILADNCFACHGPDEKARKAKLRLDVKAGPCNR